VVFVGNNHGGWVDFVVKSMQQNMNYSKKSKFDQTYNHEILDSIKFVQNTYTLTKNYDSLNYLLWMQKDIMFFDRKEYFNFTLKTILPYIFGMEMISTFVWTGEIHLSARNPFYCLSVPGKAVSGSLSKRFSGS
jgi:hypothetical protein